MGMDKIFKTELLSPCGKKEALIAAVQNGADAVYMGEKSFSARKTAENFTWEEIKEAVKYSHARGVKVHLALNTLMSDSELKDFEKSVVGAAESGVDALIIQDLGGARAARSICPEMELHASTQLTASNIYDAEALTKIGFSRIVLSRELSMEEIHHIHKNTDAELEAFVHGALCISFSGKCLMSSFIGGRSGNRGMCAQPCRQKYFCDGKNGYFLSPRDLCLASELKNMCLAGITSFKIEGRMKSPEYVAAVTGIYRKCLDDFSSFSEKDEEYLKKIFVRGKSFTKGYFCGINTPEIMNYSISNDKISSRADAEALKTARKTYAEGKENKKIFADAVLSLFTGSPAELSLSDGENTVTVKGAVGENAITTPLSRERAEQQISKLGNTVFKLRSFDFRSDFDSVISLSELNAMRRECAKALCEKRAEIFPKKTNSLAFSTVKHKNNKNGNTELCVQVSTKEQFEGAKSADRILVPVSLWKEINPSERTFVLLPQVVTDDNEIEHILSKIPQKYGVYTSSIGFLETLFKKGRRVYADWGMNIYNSLSALSLENLCEGITLSPELSLAQIQKITNHTKLPCEIICHGFQPVMTSRACLIRGIKGKCDCTEPVKITDKTGAEFLITGDSHTHLNTVYNSRITFTADKRRELRASGAAALRILLTDENEEQTKNIIEMYRGEREAVKPPLYTRGYLLSRR